MRNLLHLVLCLFLLASTGTTQTVSRGAGEAPFSIERGTSFSASTGGRVALPSGDNAVRSATVQITTDVREALEVIRGKHVRGTDLDTQAAVKSSISSMLGELDPHSAYLDAAEFSELLGEHESEYSGTGSTISSFLIDGRIETYVLATHPGSAAARADLQYGDRIVAVDGHPVSGLTTDFVRDRIRGPRGTIVRVTVERAATGKTETVEMRRERVSQPSISNYSVIRNSVGYIGLSDGFTHTTLMELNTAVNELHRRGMRSLILDLRGNSGGILDQAVGVAEKFLPAGALIISQRGRNKNDERTWNSRNQKPEHLPIVVLVDEQTASASEIVAGALQDNDRALVIGQNTFGKGLVQDVVSLPMGSGLTLTTARYFTPSGRSIQRHYSSGGRYDYFMNRATVETSHDSRPENRTLTNRPVFGGRGITPDVVTQKEAYDTKRSSLIDPIFFFVREIVSGKLRIKGDPAITPRDEVRQSIIFGTDPLPSDVLQRFRDFTYTRRFKVRANVIDKEVAFIQRQLRYQLALATFGPGAADTVLIESDGEISQAIEAIPRAALLAKTAEARWKQVETKKTRRVASPTGQGRNRRN